MPTYTVKINKVIKWKVDPYRLGGGNQGIRVYKNDKIKFVSSGTAVDLHFPVRLFGVNKISIPKNGDKTLTVQPSASDTKLRYAVYCKEEDEFASGNSYPKIITDP
jgi:hypothetical protein